MITLEDFYSCREKIPTFFSFYFYLNLKKDILLLIKKKVKIQTKLFIG